MSTAKRSTEHVVSLGKQVHLNADRPGQPGQSQLLQPLLNQKHDKQPQTPNLLQAQNLRLPLRDNFVAFLCFFRT